MYDARGRRKTNAIQLRLEQFKSIEAWNWLTAEIGRENNGSDVKPPLTTMR